MSARAAAAVRAELDPGAMHVVALVGLLWQEGAGNSLNLSISYLHTVARVVERPVAPLADLSAAYLVRAERTQNARDLMEAIETAERALELDPRNEPARFNRALAMDRLGLVEGAQWAWGEYLMVDSTSGWAEEARRREREAVEPSAPPPRDASPVELARYATAAPQEAQILGWDRLLGEWGDAVLRGDRARAAELAAQAGVLGDALERRGSDASLADAVKALSGSASNAAATRELARGHRAYAAGRRAYAVMDYAVAERSFAEALAAAEHSTPLREWAGVFHGATLLYAARTAAAERIFRTLVARADTVRHPAVAARARWALATTLFRDGRFQEAQERYREAARLYARAGERENLGAVQYLAGDTEVALGSTRDGYASMHRALVTLRPYTGSVWVHGLLYALGEAAAADGFRRAALRIQDEGVRVATRTAVPTYVAEARLARARLFAAAGETRRAMRDVGEARGRLDSIPSRIIREWLRSDLHQTEAAIAVRAEPVRAEMALDSAIAFFDVTGNSLRLLPLLLARAQARLASGRAGAAEADLRRSVELLDEQRSNLSSVVLQATLLDVARQAFDRIVTLRVAAGRPDEALAYLERGRASFAAVRGPRSGTNAVPSAPAGQVALDYALIGDSLLIWTVSSTGIQLATVPLQRDELLRTAERTRAALEMNAGQNTVQDDLTQLFDWLVRPVQARLGALQTPLVVVADGEIAGIPFAALYDRASGRYLVQDHPLRFAGTLADAAVLRPEKGEAIGGDVLLISNPAFSATVFPGLSPLRAAAAEVEEIRRVYPEAKVLGGAAADRNAVEAGVRQSQVVHYAGHAVFDDERPERSYLVLASTPDGSDPGRLAATQVALLDLRHLRLLVLSACQTSRAQDRRSGGFAGLSAAFLTAGAQGVVGSLWRVDDERTRDLMPVFHRAYRGTGDGAAALREAQLHLLGSRVPALNTPAAWAGFRYVGR